MLKFRSRLLAAVGGLGVLVACTGSGEAPQEPSAYGLGRPATEAQMKAWDIDVSPTGEGLPPGRGAATEGAEVFAAKCASCHGPTGVEGPMDRLVGGRGTLKTERPIKTVGSYWPYATTLYDYIRRAMPYNAPQSLKPDEVYAVVAWILHRNGIIPEDLVMDATTLPAVTMPNRNGFVPDPRPDVKEE
ncbi:MAG: c-type cytochrome [Nitrospiraceae bacterium]